MRLSALRKWFSPWPQPHNTIEHGKLIFHSLILSLLAIVSYLVFAILPIMCPFILVLTKDPLLVLPNKKHISLIIFLLHLSAITFL